MKMQLYPFQHQIGISRVFGGQIVVKIVVIAYYNLSDSLISKAINK